jgi:hypothetical protein
MHKNYERVLMYAHAVMVFIVALEINEAHFPHIFSFVGYRVPQPQITFGINAFFNKKKKKGDHLFLNIANNHILHPKKTEETTRGIHHL